MFNFSGSTKKRVVNLGNKKLGYNNKINFLEQSRLQRQEREYQKNKEKSAIIIQNHIRKYLDLKKNSFAIINDWLNFPINNEQDFNSWINQFINLSKWYLLKQDDDLIYQVIKSLVEQLLDSMFEIYNTDGVILALNKLLSSLKDINILDLIVQALHIVISKTTNLGEVHGMINNLVKVFNNYELLPKQREVVIDLIFMINIHDSYHDFIKVLTLDYFDSENKKYLHVLRNTIGPTTRILQFDDEELISMLSTYLVIHGSEQFTQSDFLFIGSVLENIHCRLKLKDDDDEEEEEEEFDAKDYEDDSKLNLNSASNTTTVYINDKISDSLDKLYSPVFIQGTIDLLKNESSELKNLALKILPALINLYPALKGKICMLLSIVPNCYKWFFETIKEHELFQLFINCNKDYVKTQELENIDKSSMESFWQTVFLFEELYSYWLIVSNDLESFNQDKLPIDDVKQFIDFLKVVCLTLIFSSNRSLFPQYINLKSISTTLLNQLYLKNLRMKFLPRDYWNLKDLVFNVDLMLSIIAEEEESRINAEENDEEEIVGLKRSKPVPIEILSKLEVLKTLPFFIEFNHRVKIFQALIDLDKQRNTSFNPFMFDEPKLIAKINRDSILEDAYNAYHRQGANFKNRLQVEFFNQYGKEAGIDGGGITKEFLTCVVKEGFNPDNAFELFKETGDNQLYPNDKIFEILYVGMDKEFQQIKLDYIRFLGMIVGKCLYENVLIDVSFAPFFLNKWCNDGMKNSINDLSYLDNELFKNLMKLTKMTNDELKQLELTFSINLKIDNKSYNLDLLPNGANVEVDLSNILNYIHQLANYKLNQSLKIQTKYFLEGLYSMISKSWLSMFDCFELQMLISGGKDDINIDDWKNNVEYGGYLDDDPAVIMFWEIVEEMTPQERCKLIKFVTSVSRAPLLGFGSLAPKFGIRNSGNDSVRLPTASTCVNLLKLPNYRDKKTMREKLLYAINTEAGFDLS